MIKEFEFHHGVVFSHILHSADKNISIRSYPTSDNASYVINDNIGIYIKVITSITNHFASSQLHPHISFENKNCLIVDSGKTVRDGINIQNNSIEFDSYTQTVKNL